MTAPGYGQVRSLVEERAQALGRLPPAILGAAKKQPLESLRRAADQGLEHLGESYLEEGLEHMEALRGRPLTWHFIGKLQSRKAAEVARRFDWVQSVDRVKLVDRLEKGRGAARAEEAGLGPLQVLLQAKLADEQGKGGAEPGQLPEIARAVDACPNLRLRGLMALPPLAEAPSGKAGWAALARELWRTLLPDHPHMDVLSVGTSGDWPEAVSEGATMIRLGTALFGERP